MNEVREILHEEQIAFELDSEGGVHPLVDQAFSASYVSAIAVLGTERYTAVRLKMENIDAALMRIPPDGVDACRQVFGAAEILFKLMYPRADRLASDRIKQHLKQDIDQLLSSDPTEQRVAHRVVDSFMDYVEAMHNYRHEQGKSEPHQPSASTAVLLVSQGMSFVRWLAELDRLKA